MDHFLQFLNNILILKVICTHFEANNNVSIIIDCFDEHIAILIKNQFKFCSMLEKWIYALCLKNS